MKNIKIHDINNKNTPTNKFKKVQITICLVELKFIKIIICGNIQLSNGNNLIKYFI